MSRTPRLPTATEPSNVVPLRRPFAGGEPPRRPQCGSSRRRLWELPQHAHCPIVGLCLSIDELRYRLERLFAGQFAGDDYELHVGVVQQCTTRNPVSELLQRVFDERFGAATRAFESEHDEAGLEARWDATVAGEVAGALWATLTHARCGPALEERVLRRVHMLQHHAGNATRAEVPELLALTAENATLARELGRAQERSTRLQEERAAQVDRLQGELMRLRAEVLIRETMIAGLAAELEAARRAASRIPTAASRTARGGRAPSSPPTA